MDKSREIVFHLARRLLWAKRQWRTFEAIHRHGDRPETRALLYGQFNESQNSYRVARMVLDGVEFD